jgi:hypothetical protein
MAAYFQRHLQISRSGGVVILTIFEGVESMRKLRNLDLRQVIYGAGGAGGAVGSACAWAISYEEWLPVARFWARCSEQFRDEAQARARYQTLQNRLDLAA